MKANPLSDGLEWLELPAGHQGGVLRRQTRRAEAYDSDPYFKDVDKTVSRLFQDSVARINRPKRKNGARSVTRRMPDNFRFTRCQISLFSLEGQKPSVDSIWSAYREFVAKSPASRSRSTPSRAEWSLRWG